MLRQCDGPERLKIICMDWLEVGTNVPKESFGIFSVGVIDKLQERVDKDRPKQFRQFKLELLAGQ